MCNILFFLTPWFNMLIYRNSHVYKCYVYIWQTSYIRNYSSFVIIHYYILPIFRISSICVTSNHLNCLQNDDDGFEIFAEYYWTLFIRKLVRPNMITSTIFEAKLKIFHFLCSCVILIRYLIKYHIHTRNY